MHHQLIYWTPDPWHLWHPPEHPHGVWTAPWSWTATVESLHGQSSVFEYCSTKYFLTIGRDTWTIFFLTISGLGWCLITMGRTSAGVWRWIITGAGLTIIGAGALTTTLWGGRSTTIGGCFWMYTLAFWLQPQSLLGNAFSRISTWPPQLGGCAQVDWNEYDVRAI